MMEGFNRVLSDSPENRNIERLSVKDVKPETGMSVNEAMEYVRKAYFPDSGEKSQGEVSDLRQGLTDEEKIKIKEETGWSNEIVDHIGSMEQYEIYKNAGLHEAEVDGRPCLVKDIDMDYVDPKTGMTNRERLEHKPRPLSPIDAKTGEKIELHHMGQDFNGPFAELCENSEHGDGNHSVLHDVNSESWRRDPDKKHEYQDQKDAHWSARAAEV